MSHIVLKVGMWSMNNAEKQLIVQEVMGSAQRGSLSSMGIYPYESDFYESSANTRTFKPGGLSKKARHKNKMVKKSRRQNRKRK